MIRAERPGRHLLDLGLEEPFHDGPHGLQPTVEVDRGHERFEEVGEHRRRDRAVDGEPLADDEEVGEAELLAEPAARLPAHDHRLDAGEISLERVRKQPEEPLAHQKAEDRIAEELEPFVGGQSVLGPGGVRECRDEQPRIAKHVADPPLALGDVGRRACRRP